MPATRSPARSTNTNRYPRSPPGRNTGLNASNARDGSLVLPRTIADDISTPPPASAPAKRRRTPNAFILYRSYIIANKMYPAELNHQSDVSRYVAKVWRAIPASARRSIFFKMAEDEKRRVQLDSRDPEPYRKKRSRSNKSITAQESSLHGGSSPGSGAGVPLPTASTPFSLSPLSIPAPSFGSATLPSSNAFVPSAPLAPQPLHAIPLHLLNWGQDGDSTKTDVVERSELKPTWSSSHLFTALQIPCQSDANSFDSLNTELSNLQLSLNMSTDFMSALLDTPPFGVYLPS